MRRSTHQSLPLDCLGTVGLLDERDQVPASRSPQGGAYRYVMTSQRRGMVTLNQRAGCTACFADRTETPPKRPSGTRAAETTAQLAVVARAGTRRAHQELTGPGGTVMPGGTA